MENADIYYGLNVSPSLDLEPIDQLDGFLVARHVQDTIYSKFYPFIAGVYGIFNACSVKEARDICKNRTRQDEDKKFLIESIMKNLALQGRVYTTYDIWNDTDYWRIFNEIIQNLDPQEISGKMPSRKGMPMKDFPLSLLGNIMSCIDGSLLSQWHSRAVYIPAEVAEAVWFNRKLGVSFKIGPESEKIYDDIIKTYGMGIIELQQPVYVARHSGETPILRNAMPYIGRRDQNRISFSDNLVDISILRGPKGNLSINRALLLAQLYQKTKEMNGAFSDAYKIYELVKLGRRI